LAQDDRRSMSWKNTCAACQAASSAEAGWWGPGWLA
jgi:hypothetical protein